ncbi:unnamed protein product [Arctogadus glacialis]
MELNFFALEKEVKKQAYSQVSEWVNKRLIAGLEQGCTSGDRPAAAFPLHTHTTRREPGFQKGQGRAFTAHSEYPWNAEPVNSL